MNCPYCAEEIKDAAFVCRFCNRDLTFFKPYTTRIAQLETAVKGLQEAVERILNAATVSNSKDQPLEPQQWPSIWIVGAGTALTALLFYYGTQSKLPNPFAGIIVFGAPLPLAICLLVRGGYKTLSQYVFIGLLQAFVQVPMSFAGYPSWAWSDLGIIFLRIVVYGGVDGLLFLTVGLLRRRMTQNVVNDGFRARLIAYVPSALRGTREEGWKRTAGAIAAFGPVLTLIGSILTAYLGYLGTVAKSASGGK